MYNYGTYFKKQCIEWWIWQILVMIINVLRISPHKQCPVLIKKCYCILTCKWTKVCFVFRGPCRGVSGVHLGPCLQHGVHSVSAGGGRERDPHPQVHRGRPLSQGQAQRGPPQHQDQLLLLPFRGQSSKFSWLGYSVAAHLFSFECLKTVFIWMFKNWLLTNSPLCVKQYFIPRGLI